MITYSYYLGLLEIITNDYLKLLLRITCNYLLFYWVLLKIITKDYLKLLGLLLWITWRLTVNYIQLLVILLVFTCNRYLELLKILLRISYVDYFVHVVYWIGLLRITEKVNYLYWLNYLTSSIITINDQ